MHESTTTLSAWESFYVIVGSSGGALIGLQFVVITLIADKRRFANAGSLAAFGTPTVVHFTAALFVSAIMSAPWPSMAPLSVMLGACGIGGLVYGAIVIGRARRQTDYQPVWQDWLWYIVWPFCSYALLTATAFVLHAHSQVALFLIGGAALALLLNGIHNAWDTVTHIVISAARSAQTPQTRDE